jgi:ATP-dependent RNA helicase RhlE
LDFQSFGFSSSLLEGLDAMAFNKPTAIQEQAIPIILSNKDIIACAQTGTGKTAAYVLPILSKLSEQTTSQTDTLILAPTRELAIQIDQQIQGFAYFTSVSSIAIYGGGDGVVWEQQKKALKEGAEIIIATPGRLIAQLQSGLIKLDHIKHLVLDEADRMLDMGFYSDIIKIMTYLPKERQTIMFSATMPAKMRDLASKLMRNPEQVSISISKPAEGILQQAYNIHDTQKNAWLVELLSNQLVYDRLIMFSSTKDKVKEIYQHLARLKFNIKAFHSDLDQSEREAIMSDYKHGKLTILIGTDILSRGIDIDGIDVVINYDVPPDAEDYIHRIGRTARANRTGTAITFINEKDQRKFSQIERLMEREVEKLPIPESYGPTPEYNPGLKRESNHKPRTGGGKKRFFKKKD